MNQYQRLYQNFTLNYTRFGRQFSDFCRTDAMLSQLNDHGFMDGGCYSLALAVQAELGEQVCLLRYCCTPQMAQHAVVYFPPAAFGPHYRGRGLYLDADGLGTREEVLHKMQVAEFVPDCTFMSERSPEQVQADGIVDIDRASVRLRPLLRAFFLDHPFSLDWLSPCSAAELASQRAQIRRR